MAVFTAAITQIGSEPTPVRVVSANVRYCLRITFGIGQVIYVPSHDDLIPYLPAGASITRARIAEGAMPALARNAGFESGRSTSPTTTYRIVDVGDEFNDLFSNQNTIGEGSYNRLIEDFEVAFGENLDIDPTSSTYTQPKYTGIIQDHSRDYNTITIETSDINRKVDDDIFEPLVWRLRNSISDDATTIPTTLPVGQIEEYQETFLQSDRCPQNPGVVGAYAKIGDEVFFHTGLVADGAFCTFAGVVRGQCTTSPAAHQVADDATDANKPEIKSYGVFCEPATDIPKMLITGVTADGRLLPSSWHVGEDIRWIHQPSFALHSSSLYLYFEISESEKCRDFYEKEVLALMGAVFVTDGRGRLTWTPRQRPTDSEANGIVLDDSNCRATNLVLRHIKRNISPSIKIGYDWSESEGKALSTVTYRDIESESHNNIPAGQRLKEFVFRGLRSGIHTSTQLDKLAATYGDDYFYEKQEIQVESLVNDIPLGTLVVADFNKIRDDANGSEKSLRRGMLVVASNENRQTRSTVYTLSGSLNIQSTRQASQRQHNAESDEYKRGKINIADLITVNDGVGSGTLNLENGQNYYYVDDASPGTGLLLPASMTVNINGSGPRVGLFVFGPFVCHATINLTGKSHHEVGRGETATGRSRYNGHGYAMSSVSTGGLITEAVYRTFLSSNRTIYRQNGVLVSDEILPNAERGRNLQAPDPVLDLNDGRFGGLPADLSGSAGVGGPKSTYVDSDRQPQNTSGSAIPQRRTSTTIDGSDGGLAGGGLLIVSWGGAVSDVILNGLAGGAPNTTSLYSDAVLSGGSGAGGGPGSFLWVVDGNHAPPLLNQNNVKAHYGTTQVLGSVARVGQIINSDANTHRSRYGPVSSSINYWNSVTRIAYTPEPETVQNRPESILDQFFANQRDGRVQLFVGQTPPSFANLGDMSITQEQLDGNQRNAAFEVLTSTGWRFFVRGVDDFEYVYDALIAGQREYNTTLIIASPTRPEGEPDGTIWYNEDTGVEWILYESGDVLLRDNNTPVGENLIEPNGEFIFTRNENYQARTTTNAGSGGGSGGVVGTVFGLRYEAPYLVWDSNGVSQFDIKKGTVQSQRYISSVNSSPYRYDLSDEGDGSYFVTAIPSGQNSDAININIVAGTGTSTGGGSGGSNDDITLTDRGRAVTGIARPSNRAQPFIENGQEIELTLGVETGDPIDVNGIVGNDGQFTINVSSAFDNYLGQVAQLYATNGAADDVSFRFTYEL